jgi:MFS family permease
LADATNRAGVPADEAYSSAYRTYILLLLTAVYTSNYADRMIFAVLSGQIKAEFNLSDTEIGLMGGFAFAIVYTTLGIPVAMLADRMSRKTIMTVALSVWSIFTAVCGLAGSAFQLLLARFGVAVGEAGGSPPAHSIISDLYPQNQRATALAIFSTGVPLGYMVGLFVGGQIAAAYDWRTAFMALGLPGLLLAVLVWFTLREPRRGQSESAASMAGRASGADDKAPSLATVVKFMLSQPSLRHVMIGGTIVTFVGYAGVQWNVQFLERSHNMSLSEASAVLALITVTASVAGTFLGGWLADRLGRRDKRWNTWIVAVFFAVGLPFTLVAFSTDSKMMALAFLPVPVFVAGLYIGPSFAMTQNLVGVRMRSVAAAMFLFIINFVGMGGGPVVAGILSDMFASEYAQHSLRQALYVLAFLNLWGVLHYWLAGRTLVADYDRASRV